MFSLVSEGRSIAFPRVGEAGGEGWMTPPRCSRALPWGRGSVRGLERAHQVPAQKPEVGRALGEAPGRVSRAELLFLTGFP